MPRFPLAVVTALTLLAPTTVLAQTAWVDAAVQRDVQRFDQTLVPARLDGASIGWRTGGFVGLGHLVLGGEWSDPGSIQDVRTTTVDLETSTVTVRSTFSHRTRSFSVLGGLTHRWSSHLRFSYVAGMAFTRVSREFSSTAASFVLVPPSRPTGPLTTVTRDRFRAAVAGVDVLVRLRGHVHATGGLRVQALPHLTDTTGWSVRTSAGGAWVF